MREIITVWEEIANTGITPRDPLFSEYVEKWLAKKEVTVSGNTFQSYRTYADTHILPKLGKLKIKQMNLSQLQEFHLNLLKTHSVASCKKYHVVIQGALLDAVRDDIIPNNFAEYVEFPKGKHFEGNTYSAEEATQLLQTARQEGETIYTALLLAVCYGLRRSEICGLRWKDVDFDKGELRVRNTVVKQGNDFIEQEQTKTAKSRRNITLLANTIPYFEQLKTLQEERGLTLDKICCWEDGRPINPDYLGRRATEIMKKSGLKPIRLHDLRHTTATLLAQVVSPKQVQEFLGHEDISTTMNIYTHLLDTDRKATSSALNNVLEKALSCSESCSETDFDRNVV